MKKLICLLALVVFAGGCATPLVRYYQRYNHINTIPEIEVSIEDRGSIWFAEITNKTTETIKFLTDESNYVSTDGSARRLLRGQTKIMHSDRMQPDLPIPPSAKFSGYLISESSVGRAYHSNYYTLSNPDGKGKLYLVFEIKGQKKTWVTDVEYYQ